MEELKYKCEKCNTILNKRYCDNCVSSRNVVLLESGTNEKTTDNINADSNLVISANLVNNNEEFTTYEDEYSSKVKQRIEKISRPVGCGISCGIISLFGALVLISAIAQGEIGAIPVGMCVLLFSLPMTYIFLFTDPKNEELKKYEIWIKNKQKYMRIPKESKTNSKMFDFSSFGTTKQEILTIVIFENGNIEISGKKNAASKLMIEEFNYNFNIKDIGKFEITTDKSNNNTSKIVDAAIGGLLFGAGGAIVATLLGNGTDSTPITDLKIRFTFNNFSTKTLEIDLFNIEWFGDFETERKERIRLLSELMSTLEICEKKYKPEINTNILTQQVVKEKNTNEENTMTLKNVELIKKYIETNDLEYKIEIKRRGIPDEMVEEVRKKYSL